MGLPLFAIPPSKSKHAIEMRQGFVDAPLLHSRQYYLRVRMAAEPMAGAFKSGAQFIEVINFPVEDNHVPAGLGMHGLMNNRGKIENRKPPMPEGNTGLE